MYETLFDLRKECTMPRTKTETFASYAMRWHEQSKLRLTEGTVRTNESMLRVHLIPEFGHLPLKAITYERAKRYFLDPKLSRAVAKRAIILFHTIMHEAVKDGRIAKNPVEELIVGYETPPVEIIPVTYDQLCAIEQQLPPSWRLPMWLMWGCGLRVGEALAIRTSCIRENGTILRITEQVWCNRRHSDKTVLIPLKARKARDSIRDIPLPVWLKAKIDAHIERFGITDYLFPDFVEGRIEGRSWSLRLSRCAKRAGVPGLHPHMLRHIWASTMLSAGCPIDSVSRWLGHRNVNTTFNTYAHAMPAANSQAREVSERAFAEFTS